MMLPLGQGQTAQREEEARGLKRSCHKSGRRSPAGPLPHFEKAGKTVGTEARGARGWASRGSGLERLVWGTMQPAGPPRCFTSWPEPHEESGGTELGAGPSAFTERCPRRAPGPRGRGSCPSVARVPSRLADRGPASVRREGWPPALRVSLGTTRYPEVEDPPRKAWGSPSCPLSLVPRSGERLRIHTREGCSCTGTLGGRGCPESP